MAKKQELRKAELEYELDPDCVSVYANHMLVNHTPYDFCLNFNTIAMPVESREQERLSEENKVVVSIVARVFIPPDIVPQIIEALQTNYEGFCKENNLIRDSEPKSKKTSKKKK